uniref:Uncharacterized protein n=1 Tax=Talaromyces marneffei PM1 TaxID=1077442 RepID=A0A093X7L1_TALMA
MKLFAIILVLLANSLAFNLGPCPLLGPLNACLPHRKSSSISTTFSTAASTTAAPTTSASTTSTSTTSTSTTSTSTGPPTSSSTLSRSSPVSESPGHHQPSVTPRSSLSTRVIVVTSTTTVWETA